MLLNTEPYRGAMVHYANVHDLPIPAKFDRHAHGPLKEIGSEFLEREQTHMHAQHNLLQKYIDGHLNEPTRKILIPPPPPLTMGDRAVRAAMKELGVHESPWGSNSGPRVRWYQSSTGAYNTFWCASFYWKMWQVAGYRGNTSAGAWYSTDRIGRRLSIGDAVPGCGVSFDIGKGHIGMFLGFSGSHVKTIDGNTSDEVAVRLRPIQEIHSISLPHL